MNCPDQKTMYPNYRSKLKAISLFCIFAVLLLMGLVACSSVPKRLKPANAIDLSIFQQDSSFSEYIKLSKQQIKAIRKATDPNVTEEVILANTPFEYKPYSKKCQKEKGALKYKRGILLIHGLTASPYLMQDLGKFFSKHCFLVRAILLPGHGTRPGDLLNVSYNDWVKAVNYGLQSFNGQAENLFIAGYSIGGELAIHHALSSKNSHKRSVTSQELKKNSPAVKGLFLFSPALKPKNGLAFLAGTVSLFKDWLSITEDRDFAAYESFPYNAAAQSHQLSHEIDLLLKTRTTFPIPVFLALSKDDETVDSDYTIDVFRRYMNTDVNHMQLYTNRPELYKTDQRINALQSLISNENIVSFSHTSIIVPRNHPHYGFYGDYRRCLHYLEHSPEWLECIGDPEISQGEVSQAILDHYSIRQLTYNPYYNEMLNAMEKFIERLEGM